MHGESTMSALGQLFFYNSADKSISDTNGGKLIVAAEDKEKLFTAIEKITTSDKPALLYMDICAGSSEENYAPYSAGIIYTSPGEKILITLKTNERDSEKNITTDKLTGLLNRSSFSERIKDILTEGSEWPEEKYMVVYFDVQRFKTVNDMLGVAEGDRLLKHIARVVAEAAEGKGASCRIGSDRFALVIRCEAGKRDSFVEKLLEDISAFDQPFEITCNAGIFVIEDKQLPADLIIDRAIMAQSPIKGSCTKRFNYYTEALREKLLTEQEITGMMRAALKGEQFVIYYQPQYNHSTGMLVGTEALVRWCHPEKGLIPPNRFIPVIEKNGFITKLDLYVFERVCIFLRKCLDKNLPVVPISTNLTRYDIFAPNFIEMLEETRKKYEVPSKYIRVEITESAALGNSQFINAAVKKLHSYGYIVEMDDFGSGYSSLNILKDIDFDIIKLDMRFLESEQGEKNRGGTILSSIVRMVNWLGLPIIAEGVETITQADFLRSIGCDCVQGFLYSKPLQQEAYEELISGAKIGTMIPQMKLIDTLNAANFWSSDSLETLIFSNFVGGAAIFDYRFGRAEILRVNQKYLTEFGMNLSEKEVVSANILDFFDEAGRESYLKMLEKAIETGDEQESEAWRTIVSSSCGEDKICVRTTVRMIGKSKDSYLFYAMIRNITAEKKYCNEILDSEKRFKMASEQVNIYYWEYTIATKEMRPCFRCMRDLGLPALLTNYPDSAIEMGVFPPETADMYRDWHRQIAEGVPYLEAVIPLTVGRIPFIVRYTTEFDENNKPVKAYGSAALVVD